MQKVYAKMKIREQNDVSLLTVARKNLGNAKKKLADNLFKDLIIPPQEVLFGFKMVNINDLELKKILVGNPIKVNVEYKEKDKLAFLDRSDNLIAIGIIEDGMGAPKKVIRNV